MINPNGTFQFFQDFGCSHFGTLGTSSAGIMTTAVIIPKGTRVEYTGVKMDNCHKFMNNSGVEIYLLHPENYLLEITDKGAKAIFP